MHTTLRYLTFMRTGVQVCTVCPVRTLMRQPIKHRILVNKIVGCSQIHNKTDTSKELVTESFFQSENKDKDTFLSMVDIFKGRDIRRRGHVEFIYAALRHMEEFGVHKDLEVYKSLIDILPKGRFIPQNFIQSEFMHYPKQQQCIVDVLEKMEDNGVMPDREMQSLLINIFGNRGHPVRKYWRMMYWMPKFKNLTPWPLPNTLPQDSFELAKLAIERICSVDILNKLTVYQTEDVPESIDKTWIVSGQSPSQKTLLKIQPDESPVFVEGAFQIWLRDIKVNYFILRADAMNRATKQVNIDDVSNLQSPLLNEPEVDESLPRTVHEQDDGTILAVCATGSSSRDSLLSWIRLLEKDGNSDLSRIPVLFTLKSPIGDVVPLADVKETSVK